MSRPARKCDPPRGLLAYSGACGVRAPDHGGQVDLRGSGDDGDGHASGSPSGLGPSSAGCSRRARGRSACRWRRSTGSEGISPASTSSTEDPRPRVASRRGHDRRHSQILENMRQSGTVELVPRRQGLVHSRARSLYSGSSPTSGNGRAEAGSHAPGPSSAGAVPSVHQEGRRCAPRLGLRPSAGLSPLGQGPLNQEDLNLSSLC
jgi:hypothetical protein